MLSTDSSKIYSFFSSDSSNSYIATINKSDGSIIGSVLKFSLSFNKFFGGTISGDYIVGTASTTNVYD